MRRTAMIAMLALAACGQVGDGAAETTTSTEPTEESTTTTTTGALLDESTTTTVADQPNDDQTAQREPQPPESNMTDELLDAIVANAAERTGVDPASVEVVSITEEQFSDSSLGCPEPGEFYTQVITPGYIVIVLAGGQELDYRAGTQPETFKLCTA